MHGGKYCVHTILLRARHEVDTPHILLILAARYEYRLQMFVHIILEVIIILAVYPAKTASNKLKIKHLLHRAWQRPERLDILHQLLCMPDLLRQLILPHLQADQALIQFLHQVHGIAQRNLFFLDSICASQQPFKLFRLVQSFPVRIRLDIRRDILLILPQLRQSVLQMNLIFGKILQDESVNIFLRTGKA